MARETLRRLVAPAELSAASERDWYHPSLPDSADRIQLLAPTDAWRSAANLGKVQHTTAIRAADDVRGKSNGWIDAEAEETI